MKDYVELDRRFVPFDAKESGEHDTYAHLWASNFGSKSWNDILANRCTVIVAEALNGKTTEMQQRTHALRKAGTPAFFCRLDFLAQVSFEKAIEIGTPQEFEKWKATDARGYFFLDSVDEAKLASPQDFERAILNFVDAIAPYKDRVGIFISTRPHAWQAYADRAMLESRLALGPASKEPVSRTEPDDALGEEVADSDSVEAAKDNKSPTIAILKMAPLTEEQVRTFAAARKLTDVDAFIDAIERADADVFATTPADLSALIERWKKQKRIGRYSEVVEDNILIKLSETNPKHQYAATIPPERAHEGAMALAAALTLTQRTSILLPDQPVDRALRDSSIDPNEVLTSWSPGEVQTLLGRGLFDESLYGTVRFHHRTAREYLTARWFEQLLERRKNRRAVERLFFAEPYGTQPTVTIGSMKPILGWLCAWDQRFRDRVRHIDPKLLLEFGDASALDTSTRESLLKGFAERYKDRKNTPISLHVREVRRLADPALSNAIRSLLETYRYHDDVRQLLLRIIREGIVPGCGGVASTFALDKKMDSYTRICAVEAVGAAGTADEKRKLAKKLIAAAPRLDRQVASAAVESLWPDALSDADIQTLLETGSASKRHSTDQLALELDVVVRKIPAGQRLLEMLRASVSLLTRPPLHSRHTPISKEFDWLLPFVWKLAKRVIESAPSGEFDMAVLTAVSLSERADHLQRYTEDVDREAAALIESNRSLWYSLFWYEVDQVRQRQETPVNECWMAIRSGALMPLDERDGERFFQDVQSRPLLDDKLVALSMLTTIYDRFGKAEGFLARIKVAVSGNRQLEDALKIQIAPRRASEEVRKAEAHFAESKQRREARKLKNERTRGAWIDELRKDPARVGDLSIAAEGKVWNHTVWLFDEIRKKLNRSTSWTIAGWELLEPDFGSEVARRFREFCQAFWRLYKPMLRSETGADSTSTSWAVIVGLSGLAMEARTGPEWSKAVTDDQAALAARYAFWELNDLPSWFTSLYLARPHILKSIILNEVRWQLSLSQPDAKAASHYVLSRLRWSAKELGQLLRNDIISLVETYPNANKEAVAEALTIILRDPSPLPPSFSQFAAKQAAAAAADRKALWLAVLLCVDAEQGLAELEAWINAGANRGEKENRFTAVLENIWGDRTHGLDSQHQDFLRVEALTRLLKLAYKTIRFEDDISHESGIVYSPGARDHAQRARGRILESLYNISGKPTFDALRELAALNKDYPADHLLNMAERRAEADVEHRPWQPTEVASFADEAECNPMTQKDLFEIALSRLDDLKLEYEEGDESEAALLAKVSDEIELRRALANRLRNAAHGKYTTGSEEELADITRTDIRLHNPAVDARIPIEVKIAGKWQARVLKERLKNQLVSQYMREARYGILLVVNRGAKGDLKTWSLSGKRVDFSKLIDWLSKEAKAFLAKKSSIDGLQIVGIDLRARDRSRQEKASRRKHPKERGKPSKNKKKRSVPRKMRVPARANKVRQVRR